MSFHNPYQQQVTPAEFHNLGSLSLVDPGCGKQNQGNDEYQEIDFTNYRHNQQTLLTTSGVPRYPIAMDVGDDFSYPGQQRLSYLADAALSSTNTGTTNSPFSYSPLIDIKGTQQSGAPSITSPLATSSSISEPSITSIHVSKDETICPVITGEIDTCQPERCGPDAPCMNFTNIPPIEECTKVPCIMTAPNTQRASSPERTSTNQTSQCSQSTKKSPSASTSRAMSKVDANKRRTKQAHSLVEKKYRENLNAKIGQLHDTLKTVRYGPKKQQQQQHREHQNQDDDSDEFTTSINPCNGGGKFRKGDVLDDALDYINQTEVEMRHMKNEIHGLMDMVGMLERRLKFEAARSGNGMITIPM